MHTRRCFAAPNRQQFYLEFDINQLAFLKSVTISTSKHQEAKNARAPPKNAPTSPTDEGTIYKLQHIPTNTHKNTSGTESKALNYGQILLPSTDPR